MGYMSRKICEKEYSIMHRDKRPQKPARGLDGAREIVMLSLMKTLAGKIRDARKSAGLLQGDLACTTGISQSQISRIEAGKSRPHGDDLQRIARACGTTVAELYGEVVRESAAPYKTESGGLSVPVVGEVNTARPHIPVKSKALGNTDLFSVSERALVVRGDALKPFAGDGDKIIVDTAKPPQDGGICLARIKRGGDRGTFIKRFVDNDRDTAFLLPPVGQGEKPVIVKKADADFFRVVGVRYKG